MPAVHGLAALYLSTQVLQRRHKGVLEGRFQGALVRWAENDFYFKFPGIRGGSKMDPNFPRCQAPLDPVESLQHRHGEKKTKWSQVDS